MMDPSPENTPPEADKFTDPELQKDITQDPNKDYAEGLEE
jgi:hypothetical protein